jgi:hypothetical protein
MRGERGGNNIDDVPLMQIKAAGAAAWNASFAAIGGRRGEVEERSYPCDGGRKQ